MNWIKVGPNMPNDFENVLVYSDTGWGIGWWDEDFRQWWDKDAILGDRPLTNVTHWARITVPK